jgi:hypothetical protein
VTIGGVRPKPMAPRPKPVDAVDHRREPLAPLPIGCEKDADRQRLAAQRAAPELFEAAEQEAGVAGFVEIGLVGPVAALAGPR